MMKRTLAAAVVLGLVSLVVPATAAPPASDVKGNQCLDIADGKGLNDDGDVAVRVILSKPSCASAIYTLTVYDDETSTTPLAVVERRGDGTVDPVDGPVVDFFVTVDDVGDDYSCVVVTTARGGGRVVDRGPDEGCFEVYDPDSGLAPAKRMR
jgi:hypothetical protein